MLRHPWFFTIGIIVFWSTLSQFFNSPASFSSWFSFVVHFPFAITFLVFPIFAIVRWYRESYLHRLSRTFYHIPPTPIRPLIVPLNRVSVSRQFDRDVTSASPISPSAVRSRQNV
jgi:hypothetical protein